MRQITLGLTWQAGEPWIPAIRPRKGRFIIVTESNADHKVGVRRKKQKKKRRNNNKGREHSRRERRRVKTDETGTARR